ncbi:hypothetical protein D8O27_09100 [Burkholderia mallei]|uniref:Uncharacterized protein n=3 Tax=pseudomallei group TaxID=111527 RepID=A0AAX1X2F3_BURML|nr:hypothetical protein BOC37_22570 [Burkholderia pseudomallei]EDP86577.1 hypothetical protein BMA10399_C0411 [Burkholderia mallei ATCC 10399]EDU08813.1 hypothetical protein BURPS1655_K0090 [Burkholderia pseudomallei 1655]EEC36780.1 conserved hypothetical protein [Burkholderia pseudomallei 576]EET06303.1 hypothetical protein BURPS1710A_1562 [Burkholderia pseudomallei 1710a]EXJ02335.1 hypothetical protein T210_0109550 [Burkholderia pseudomallei MSHR6137]PNX01215.1 hypothetical protein CF649_20
MRRRGFVALRRRVGNLAHEPASGGHRGRERPDARSVLAGIATIFRTSLAACRRRFRVGRTAVRPCHAIIFR